MNTQEKRKCGNCRYFSVHYAVSAAKFIELLTGHCRNRRQDGKEFNVHKDGCESWEPREIYIDEQKKHIKSRLTAMAKEIKMFAEYFETLTDKDYKK